MSLYQIDVKLQAELWIITSSGKHQIKLDTSPVCTTKLILKVKCEICTQIKMYDKEYQPKVLSQAQYTEVA